LNRLEKILEEKRKNLKDAEEYEFTRKVCEKQVKFFEWLLEEADSAPVHEVHDCRISPTVWGMGDVSYHISIQLHKIKMPSMPIALVFDYKENENVVN